MEEININFMLKIHNASPSEVEEPLLNEIKEKLRPNLRYITSPGLEEWAVRAVVLSEERYKELLACEEIVNKVKAIK